jgi:hypothetical protein
LSECVTAGRAFARPLDEKHNGAVFAWRKVALAKPLQLVKLVKKRKCPSEEDETGRRHHSRALRPRDNFAPLEERLSQV